MWVWRDESDRITSVTGSIHRKTLDWLLAEDDWRFGSAPTPVVEAEPEPAISQQAPVEPEPPSDSPAPTAPKTYASKAEWVAFAVAKTAGSESPVSEEDAEAMTKDDLIELYGGN